jgi:serine phosphatase RsbU (regulator of sigma subunit)
MVDGNEVLPPLKLVVGDQTWECLPGEILGRSSAFAGGLLQGKLTLSRRHFVLDAEGSRWYLTQLPETSNPSYLDGHLLLPGKAVELSGHHEVWVEEESFGLEVGMPAGHELHWGGGLWAGMDVPGEGAGRAGGAEVGGIAAGFEHDLDELGAPALVLDGSLAVVEANGLAKELLGEGRESLRGGLGGISQREMLALVGGDGGKIEVDWKREDNGRVLRCYVGGVWGAGRLVIIDDLSEHLGRGDVARQMAEVLAARLKNLALFSISRSFQGGEVARSLALLAVEALKVSEADRLRIWLIDEADGGREISCSVAQGHGATFSDHPIPLSYCEAFFDRVFGEGKLASEREGSPVLSILKEIGFVGVNTATVLACGVGHGSATYGMVSFERDGDRPWSLDDRHYGLCVANFCLIPLQISERNRTRQLIVEREERLQKEQEELGRYVGRILPPGGDYRGAKIAVSFHPAGDAGGDAYGFHWIDDKHLAVYVLDVTGHGLGAALLAISAANAIRSNLLPGADVLSPASVLAGLNNAFQMEEHGDRSFTIWYGVYERESRRLDYASGGHPPALLLAPGRTLGAKGLDYEELSTQGPWIGGVPGFQYKQDSIQVPEGSRLVVISDGAFEIDLREGRQWSFEEFLAAVRSTLHMEEAQVDYLYRRVKLLHREDELPDDFTIVTVDFAAI